MLATYPIGFSVPAADLVRAKHFYAEKLGLAPISESPIRLVYECDSSSFALVLSNDAGKAAYALLTWYVDDLLEQMTELRSRGVNFEDFDFPELKTTNGVAHLDNILLAWFKDSEGNRLALGQFVN